MNAREALSATLKVSRQRVCRLLREVRGKYPDGVEHREVKTERDFPRISQHLSVFRANVSRLADDIQDEDRARLLEPTGPKILRGYTPRPRPQTAIIARAAQAMYEKRAERERLEFARAVVKRRRA
jgi:hypothetical protein